jgi:uncharacterized membrane protein YoaK (UPF0700 family)
VEVRRGVPLVVLALALTVVAGATDVASFTRLGQVFASVMTGNLALLALAAARASSELAAHIVVAITGYVAGVALRQPNRRPIRRRSLAEVGHRRPAPRTHCLRRANGRLGTHG